MRGVLVILFLVATTGCGGGDNSISSSTIVGTWITERCEQDTDRNGVLLNTWSKGLYEFTPQTTVILERVAFEDHGAINFGRVTYSDSNCEVITDIQARIALEQPVLYQDLGEVILQEGILGHEFIVVFTMPDSFRSVDGFYTLNNGSLCFSDVFLSVFHANLTFPTESTAIDFDNCLIEAGTL